jgi:hypothetical protein
MPRLFWTALIIGVVAADAGSARLPGEASQPERLQGFNPARIVNDPARVVNRVMSFDRDADGRITKDELPERMQELIARHDLNDDGVLTVDEVRVSVDSRFSVPGGVITSRAGADEGLPGVINELKLPASKREQALAIIQGQQREQALAIVQGQPAVRHLNDPANAEIRTKMRQLLDDEEYADFEAAARRLTFRRGVVGGIVR